MEPGYDGELFILAFDHRGSFKKKMFSIGEPQPGDQERLEAAKTVVWQGFKQALDNGLPAGAGILVDEEMGAAVAREARHLGVPFAMPVERSGQPVFDFEYADDFGSHIEEYDPTFAKVLVRWNPDDDPETKGVQGERLSALSAWLRDRGRLFLFELLVPPSDAQLESAATVDDYDRRLRPGLMLQAIDEIRSHGVEPDIWKIEGIDDGEDCEAVAALTMADGRKRVRSVVLGRGADSARVEHWLEAAAPVDGYAGFAIGRSIWWDAIEAWRDGKVDEATAAEQIAASYRRFIDVYSQAT
jgi:myo-inositol catabolism protein IolC